MKKNLIISLLVILICLFGFYIYNEYFTPTYTDAQPNYSFQEKTSSVKCKRYDIVQAVRKHLKKHGGIGFNGRRKYWDEENSNVSSYKFDITQSGNTFVVNVSAVRTNWVYETESIINVGTFTFLCSNNGELTLSSAFGIFDD